VLCITAFWPARLLQRVKTRTPLWRVHFRFRQLRTCLPLSLGQPYANSQLSVRLLAYCEVGRVPELGVNLYGRDVHSERAAKLAGEKAFPSRAATAVLYSFLWAGLVSPFQYFPRVFCFDQTRAFSIR
jgi:hypothetical protein